jgi:hypothetical protein
MWEQFSVVLITLLKCVLSAQHTRSDNKVHELTAVRLLWQRWTETSVLFDDFGISAVLLLIHGSL